MKTLTKSQLATMPSIFATILVALACALNAGTAQASDSLEPMTKKVTYGDLNLDTASGAKALYARLSYAAKYVCSPYESKGLSRQKRWQNCVNNALDSAVQKINKPMVTALYRPSVDHSGAG